MGNRGEGYRLLLIVTYEIMFNVTCDLSIYPPILNFDCYNKTPQFGDLLNLFSYTYVGQKSELKLLSGPLKVLEGNVFLDSFSFCWVLAFSGIC